ncbi:hypothetical protein [Clostridium butyricum]|uniref:hypothetical protein n=1 Tax=Clostridium butyricum TaxID=1492 RepID=UPI0011DE4743|nr:hypothetical protein [Clostridium butyricum]
MIEINENMKKLIESSKNINYNIEKLNDKVNKFIIGTKLIKNCVILDFNNELNESNINVERILRINNDWTGYESNCNEVEIDYSDVPLNYIEKFANTLCYELKKKYEGRKFCIIIIADEKINVRFHTYRKEEGMWLSEDINQYDEPILLLVK